MAALTENTTIGSEVTRQASWDQHYPDLNAGHPEMYLPGVVVTVLSCAAYVLPYFVAIPAAAAIQIVALNVLAAIRYGIMNDVFSCKKCVEYFTVGHSSNHKRFLETDNVYLNGIVWGITDSWIGGLLVGVVMATATRATNLVALSALQLTPFAIALSFATFIISDYSGKQEEEKWSRPDKQQELNAKFDNVIIEPEAGYHVVDLSKIPQDKRAAYLAIEVKNEVNNGGTAASTALLAIGAIATRIFLTIR
jgi:hypothetical protein